MYGNIYVFFSIILDILYWTQFFCLFCSAFLFFFFLYLLHLFEPQHKKTCHLAYAPNEHSYQQAYLHSLIRLRYPHEEALHPWLSKMHTVKMLIRPWQCAVWSECSLGLHGPTLRKHKKNNIYPFKPQFYYIKVGLKRVIIIWACFHDIKYIRITIRKTRLFEYTEKFTTKNWKISDKTIWFFHISAQNIDCGYSLEPPRRGGSNEHPQFMFLCRNKKINIYPCKAQFYIKSGVYGG